ncbi:hypothetical protein [Chryseobacterium taeanense]|uniref:hypothetical protein n=1 Tax=Chryseobacterium taeanense TaxID=311334 RepID=UPI0035B4CB64
MKKLMFICNLTLIVILGVSKINPLQAQLPKDNKQQLVKSKIIKAHYSSFPVTRVKADNIIKGDYSGFISKSGKLSIQEKNDIMDLAARINAYENIWINNPTEPISLDIADKVMDTSEDFISFDEDMESGNEGHTSTKGYASWRAIWPTVFKNNFGELLKLEVYDVTIYLNGNMATTVFKDKTQYIKDKKKGDAFNSGYMCSFLWHKVKGEWRILVEHGSKLK